jgi:hypothetical protein
MQVETRQLDRQLKMEKEEGGKDRERKEEGRR